MKQAEINAIVKRYEKAIEAEKKAKQIQKDCHKQLKDELRKFKNLLIVEGDLNFAEPIDVKGSRCKIVGLFYDDEYKELFPEGRVRLKVARDGIFSINFGVTENASLLAKVIEVATKEANKLFNV